MYLHLPTQNNVRLVTCAFTTGARRLTSRMCLLRAAEEVGRGRNRERKEGGIVEVFLILVNLLFLFSYLIQDLLMGVFAMNLRNIGPLCFGFFFGSLVSLIVFPSLRRFSTDLCSTNRDVSLAEQQTTNNDIENNYEPVIVQTQPGIKSNAGKKSKLIRPRFYATELGVKDKLFVTVIIRKENLTFAVALNKTIAHHVNRLLFFSDTDINLRITNSGNNVSNQLFLITWPKTLTDETSKFYFVLNYVAEHFLNNYDWFYFVTDSTYVKAFKLYEFATHLSCGFDVVLGKKRKHHNYCSLESGFLISHGGLKKISSVLSKCREGNHEIITDSNANFNECFENYAGIKCTEEWNVNIF